MACARAVEGLADTAELAMVHGTRKHWGWGATLAMLVLATVGATSRSAGPPAQVAALLLARADAPPGWTWTYGGANPYRASLMHAHVHVGVTQVTEYLQVYATMAQAQAEYNTLWAPPPYRLRLPAFGVQRTGFRAPFSWTPILSSTSDTKANSSQNHVYQAFDDAWFWRGRYVVQINVVTEVPPMLHPADKQAWAQLQAVYALDHYAQLIDSRLLAKG